MKKKKQDKRINFRISKEEYSKIESIANDEGKTISEVVRSWLTKAAIDHLQSKIDDLKECV